MCHREPCLILQLDAQDGSHEHRPQLQLCQGWKAQPQPLPSHTPQRAEVVLVRWRVQDTEPFLRAARYLVQCHHQGSSHVYSAMALPILVIHLELPKRNTGFQAELGERKRSSFHCPLVL